jgi:hypothetical protein
MGTLGFSSVLPDAYRDELERIVFFNPKQNRVRESLIDCVHRYGVPVVVAEAGTLRFRVPAFGLVQSLYALGEGEQPARLLGVAMFVRESRHSVLLLHLAVHEDYAADGVHAGAWVTPRLLAMVRSACQRVRGITSLRLLYPHAAQVKIRSGKRGRRPAVK